MFISIDGQHGAGKTFNVNSLQKALESKGYSVSCFSEPSYSPLGKIARCSEEKASVDVAVCLFAADKRQGSPER